MRRLSMQKDFEYLLENNALRAKVREQFEVKPLRRAAEVGHIGHALQIACGCGSSSAQLMRYFSIGKLSAIEREAELVERARNTHAPDRYAFYAQDVFSMGFGDSTFDAVFNLADLHNYAEWEVGLLELRRVLKPGGLLIMEELSRESFESASGRVFRRLTEHPYGSMLTVEGFRESALRCGFEILAFEERNPFGLLKYFIMVARKP
jgi:ubiquinone/menaquinone biosynthesis C-methylase UbiE